MENDKLDMSLDDIIEQQKRRSGLRGRRGGVRKRLPTGRLTSRRGRGRGRVFPTTFREPQLDARGKWRKDSGTPRRNRGTTPGRFTTRPKGTFHPVTIPHRPSDPQLYATPQTDKLFLSNLEYRVSERDLLELFSQIGPLQSVRINYDKSGRSLGTGEVTFQVPFHATMAERRFNGILIDSKPLVIQKSGVQVEQNMGPTKLSSGITVVDPNHGPSSSSQHGGGSKMADTKAVHTLKSAVVATIAPEHPSLGGPGAGPRIRSSIMRSGMYSDRMDIG